MPQPLNKEQFIYITTEISRVCSFVLAPLGFPQVIREMESKQVFTERCEAIFQQVLEIVSDIVYERNQVDESIMALSAHLWVEERSDVDAKEAMRHLNTIVHHLFQPPDFVEIPNIPEQDVPMIVYTMATCIHESLKQLPNTAYKMTQGIETNNMYYSVVYQLGFLPPQQQCPLDSALYTKAKIHQICKGIEQAFSTMSYEFQHVEQLHALIDSSAADDKLTQLIEDAFFDYYLIADKIRDQSGVITADELMQLEDTMRPWIMKGDRCKRYDPRTAIDAYQMAICQAPLYHFTIIPTLVKMADCFLQLKQLPSAVKYCTMALYLNPTDIPAHVCMAQIYENAGNEHLWNDFIVPRKQPQLDSLQFYVNAFVLDGSRSISLADDIERVSRQVGQELAFDLFFTTRDSPNELPATWLMGSYFASFSDDMMVNGARFLNPIVVEEAHRDNLATEDLVKRAFHLKHEKRYKESLCDCLAAVERCDVDNSYKILNLYASYLYLMGNLVDALKIIDNSLMLQPDCLNSLLKKASILGEMNQIENAEELFDSILAYDSSYSDVYLHRGQFYLLRGDFQKAVINLRQSYNQCSKLPVAHVTYGMALYKNRSVFQARQVFQKALLEFPESVEVPLFYGDLCADLNNVGESMRQYRRASVLAPDCPLPFLNAGRAFVAMKDPSHAIEHFARAMDIDPRCSAAYLDRAQAHFAEGNTTDAFLDFEKAIQYARFLPEVEDAISHREIAKAQLWITEKLGVELRHILKTS